MTEDRAPERWGRSGLTTQRPVRWSCAGSAPKSQGPARGPAVRSGPTTRGGQILRPTSAIFRPRLPGSARGVLVAASCAVALATLYGGAGCAPAPAVRTSSGGSAASAGASPDAAAPTASDPDLDAGSMPSGPALPAPSIPSRPGLEAGCVPSGPVLDGAGRSRSADASDPYPSGAEPWAGFRRTLLGLVNRDRRTAGVPELAADAEAMAFAQAEAMRQVEEGAFGHYAEDGSKPYQRWARRGRTAHVRENLFRLRGGERRACTAFDPARAQARLMASVGHRRNVLDPAHTGLGVGVAYDRVGNSVIVVQEFVNRYVTLEPSGPRWRAGESREVLGRVLPGVRVEPWMAVLYREPAPGSPATRREARRRSYQEGSDEPALVLSPRAFGFHRSSGEFRLRMTLPPATPPGPYSLIVYVAEAELAAAPPARRSTAQGLPAAVVAYEVEQ